MGRLFLIADCHFQHHRLVELAGRPPDFTEQIIANWQRLVAPDDTVINLGDVQIGQMSTFAHLQAQLPGFKVLLRGNHDHERPNWYYKRGIHLVMDEMRIGRILLSHAPTIPLPDGVTHCIHGHYHTEKDSHRMMDFTGSVEAEFNGIYYHKNRSRFVLLSIEETLSPILFQDFCEQKGIMT